MKILNCKIRICIEDSINLIMEVEKIKKDQLNNF